MWKRSLACSVLVALLGTGLAVMSYSSASADNGAPSGSHYNLNIIGVDNDHAKKIDFDGGNGHRIFVLLDGITKIYLTEGTFDVTDANGTDGIAGFQLPNPDPDNDGHTDYSVFVRGVGKPPASAQIKTAFEDGGVTFYSTADPVTVTRAKGDNPVFTNESRKLLYVYYGGKRIPLFSEAHEAWLWEYNNDGLKVAQFRFYEISTDVN